MPVATMTGRMASASEMAITPSSSATGGSGGATNGGGRRGRRPTSVSFRAKLERSRQSARECRARKKLRYQYLEELVANREKAIFALRDELKMFKEWCLAVDGGDMPPKLVACLAQHRQRVQCTSSSSVDSTSAGSELPSMDLKPSISTSLHSPTVSSSLGSPRQLLPVATIKSEAELSPSSQPIQGKREPTDTRWHSRMDMQSSRVVSSMPATVTTSGDGLSSQLPEANTKPSFLNSQTLPSDGGFDITDETLTLSDVFEFD